MESFTISGANDIDPVELADIRVAVMRPSLEAAGRFDPDRARHRFLATYECNDTYLIHIEKALVGFFVLRQRPDDLYLDHLYIRKSHQGKGLGRRIVRWVQDEARVADMVFRLMALRGSPANEFYRSCGFVAEASDDLDIYYVWPAAARTCE